MITWSAHISMLFRELPLPDRFGAAAAAGFGFVELWSPFGEDLDALVDAVRASGVRVASFNLDSGDLAAGERGFLNLPARRPAVLENVREALALAERLGTRKINAPVGNHAGGADHDEELEEAAITLREAARLAEEYGVMLLVEPLNPLESPRYLVPSAEAATALIDRVGEGAVGMLYDAYHAARSGRDPAAEVRRFGPLIRHVQLADSPGRHEPGTGMLNVDELVRALYDVGYEGTIGLEYLPTSDTLLSLAWLPRELRRAEASAALEPRGRGRGGANA